MTTAKQTNMTHPGDQSYDRVEQGARMETYPGMWGGGGGCGA